MLLGVNLNSLTKVLKCAKDDGECTLKASDNANILVLVYEAKSASSSSIPAQLILATNQRVLPAYRLGSYRGV
jgi:hypothetical protein